METEFTWWLLFPLLLSIVYGCTQTRIKALVHQSGQAGKRHWLVDVLLISMLMITWPIWGYPLPILYLVIYLLQATSLVTGRRMSAPNWFLLNLYNTNTIALHLIIIGMAALTQGTTMYALLQVPIWRIVSVSVLMGISLLEDVCFITFPKRGLRFVSQTRSEEARPFMAYLWFCTGYLLLDSTLCVFELEPLYPPLFLIGSSIAVMFIVVRFLLHINKLIQNHVLKEEHDRLATRLGEMQESTDTLQQLAQRDSLTGAYSRRYAMERIGELAVAGTPFSLIFMDLDALKQINDTQGHAAGDAYLIGFVRVMQHLLRERDLLARVGGDEFIVLMPECEEDVAMRRMEMIRVAMEQNRDGETAYHFSYGVTTLPDGKITVEQLMHEADSAMYQDKVRRRKERGRL